MSSSCGKDFGESHTLYWGEDRFCFKAFVRFGGSETALPWRYDSAGYLDRPAQGPDGTIYAIEHIGGARYFPPDIGFPDLGNNKSIVILDGATGHVTARVALAPETYRDACGLSENEPLTVGPIVGSDGSAYLLARRSDRVATGPCNSSTTVSSDQSWSLLRLSRTGQISITVVDQCQMSSCGSLIEPKQLMPDGIGGLLVRASSQSGNRLIRFDAAWQRTEHVISAATRIDLVGQAGMVYLQTKTGTDDMYGITQGLDVTTFTAGWTASPGWNLVAARPGGGGTALGAGGELRAIGANGQPESSVTFGLAGPIQASGSVIGQDTATAELKAIVYDSLDGTRWSSILERVSFATYEPGAFGSQRSNLAPYVDCLHAPFLGEGETPGTKPRSVPAGASLTFKFDASFPANSPRIAPVIKAFELWTKAVTQYLGTSFSLKTTPGAPDIWIRNDPLQDQAFGETFFVKAPNGRDITGGQITLNNSSTGALTSDPHYLKAALHEIGHFMGLDDIVIANVPGSTSVMKYWSGPNDPLGWGSWVVTSCDAERATAAASRPWP